MKLILQTPLLLRVAIILEQHVCEEAFQGIVRKQKATDYTNDCTMTGCSVVLLGTEPYLWLF